MPYALSQSKTKLISIAGRSFSDGLSIKGFESASLNDINIEKASEQGIRVHNGHSLNIADTNIANTKGDGIYLTRTHNAVLDNIKIEPPVGLGADGVQFAYENDDSNISKNAHVKGCILLQGPDSESTKGGLVCEKTEGYLVEQSYIQGKNFAFSSIGNKATVRSCLLDYARLNDYSFGYGLGEQHHLADHHLYDCLIRDANRGFSLSSFRDSSIVQDGVEGYQRRSIVLHDTIIETCDVGFFADRAWSGRVYRVIFKSCKRSIINQGRATQTTHQQRFGPLMTNDGSFLCLKAPTLTRTSDGKISVLPAEWSDTPDEVRYIWRENGFDVQTNTNMTVFLPKLGTEVSCVALARRGENWMLAIAETVWAGWVPRAWTDGFLPWQNRYLVS
jgi:hypothetical protein